MESAVLRSGRDNSSCHYPKSPHNLRLWHPYHGPASAYQELVRKNLAFHGKTEEEFAAGVERAIKAEQELFG